LAIPRGRARSLRPGQRCDSIDIGQLSINAIGARVDVDAVEARDADLENMYERYKRREGLSMSTLLMPTNGKNERDAADAMLPILHGQEK